MRFSMLGPLEIRGDDGEPIEIGGARLRALLVRLALDPGRVVTVEALVDALWGETPPAGAVNAVQSLVSRLRRALGNGHVQGVPAGYRLAADPADVDVHQFQALVAAGREAQADPARAAALLRDALALWRGPALADVAEAPFATAAAARLEQRRLAATEDRISADLALGRHAEVVAELDSLAAAHPLRERLQAQRITALYGAGRQADALAAYNQTRRTLADELGVDPSAELEEVHLAVLRQDPALRTTAPLTNLRSALTSFVGRDEEVERVGTLLAEARLVTLVGPGGAGKTRLATESAGTLIDRMPDGVWFVELAPVRDAHDVPQAALAALGEREVALLDRVPGTRDALQRLQGALGRKRLLLILDNCEHLVEAAARFADGLLASCPDVRVLATSREPLSITGETVYPVPPLALPPADAELDQALAYPAVRLFADRAAAARIDFTVDAANAGAVVEICRRLDGQPLAIELAAARLRSLSVQQIAERLGDRFRLLTGGSRTALPRHQTLRAVVEWSWDLLTEPERILARRLSVFAGGAALNSAEQVCGLPPDEVLDLLAALVDKSLVDAVQTGGDVRYRMLETVRAYAAERLDEAGEVEVIRAAHAAHFHQLAATAEPLLRTADQLSWLARLDAEHDNLRAAIRWAVDAGQAGTAVGLGASLGWFWLLRGHHAEGAALLGEALAVPGEIPPATLAQAQAFQAAHALASGDTSAAMDSLEAALATSAGLDPLTSHPAISVLQPVAAAIRGDYAAARAILTARLDHADPWTAAFVRAIRAQLADNEGDSSGVEEDLTESLRAYRAIGERWGQSTSLSTLAGVRGLSGDYAGAIDALTNALGLIANVGSGDDELQLLGHLAVARARAGDLAGAEAALTETRAVASRRGSRDGQVALHTSAGEVARRRGDLATARRHHEEAFAVFEAGTGLPPQPGAWALAGLGYVALAEGNLDEARRHQRRAIELALVPAGDMPIVAIAVDGLAATAVRAGDPALAAALLGAAVRLRGRPDLGDPDVVHAREQARTALGATAYDEAYARGAGLSKDGAIALIRGG